MTEPKDKPFTERYCDRNIRYICYSLLSKVRFKNEPVVPKILAEREEDKLRVKRFEVERLAGEDLVDYVVDKDQPKDNKLRVILHVVRQLKAIDEAGYVIFDRHGSNIRVVSNDPAHISTRQMDIEDMYDKLGDCVYSLNNASADDDLIDLFKVKGVSPWAVAVDKLTKEGELIGETHGDQRIVGIFSLCEWVPGEKGHDLSDLEKACLRALKLK